MSTPKASAMLPGLKPGTRAARGLQLDRAAVNEEARTATMAVASETPYDRWWGTEVLKCSAANVRLQRMLTGANLLMDHNTRDVVGVVESVQIGADKVVRAVVRFGRSARAEEVWTDVRDGIRRSVSVGYLIHEAVLARRSEDEGELDEYHVTDWEPYEVSLVSVPADPTVGIGRAADEADPRLQPPAAAPAPIQAAAHPPAAAPATATLTENRSMDTPALNVSADAAATVAAERARVREISAIRDQFAKFQGVKDACEKALHDGSTVDQVRSVIMQHVAAAQTAPAPHLDMEPKQVRRYSLMRAIRAMVDRDWRGAEFERECSAEILKRAGIDSAPNGGFFLPADVQKRDLTVGTATAGGNLVGTDLVPSSFIDLLRARAVVAQLGARMLPGLVGNVAIPKLTGAATAYWLANEASTITESNHTFGQLSLTPKHVGAYTEISRQLMMQSTPAVDQLVMDDFARVLALAIDKAALEGAGSNGEPTGISNTANIGSVTGTSLDLADCLEFQSDLAGSNALQTGCAYVTTPAVAALLAGRARISSTDSVTLWRGNILDGQIEGFRATTTTQIAAGSMTFGDFSQVVIGEWGFLELAMNPYASFTAAITGIRAIQTVDVGIRHAAAFSRATSIT